MSLLLSLGANGYLYSLKARYTTSSPELVTWLLGMRAKPVELATELMTPEPWCEYGWRKSLPESSLFIVTLTNSSRLFECGFSNKMG